MMKFCRANVPIIYPIFLVASFYATWFAARYYLGHWPVAMVDDPQSIQGFWMWTYPFFMGLLGPLGQVVAVLLSGHAVISLYAAGSERAKIALLKMVTGVILLFSVYLLFGNEPHDILGWLLD